MITQLRPQVQFLSQQDNNVYALTYRGDYGFYASSSNDDYNDHAFTFDVRADLGPKARATLTADYSFLHEGRGTGASEGVGASRRDPDELDSAGLAGGIEFGAADAIFNVGLEASTTDLEYQNNRSETMFRDRRDNRFAGTVYWRVAPRTRLLLEAGRRNIEYDTVPLVSGSLDSDEQTLKAGVSWAITGKTEGTFKAGRTEKDFDEASRGDEQIASWDLDVSYSPRTYSSFLLSANRGPKETNGTGSFIDSKGISLAWQHAWSERLHTTLHLASTVDEFFGSTRDDDIDQVGISLDYDFRRWLNVAFGYSNDDKDSNLNQFDYDRNVFTVSVNLSL
jgi:hypothetical protein